MKNKNKVLLVTIITILSFFNISNSFANEEINKIKTFTWIFEENKDLDESWNLLFDANLKLNWYYFFKNDFEKYINKNVEVVVEFTSKNQFYILETKIIEDISPLTYEENQKLYFFVYNVNDLSKENKRKVVNFIKRTNINFATVLFETSKLSIKEVREILEFIEKEKVSIIIQ